LKRGDAWVEPQAEIRVTLGNVRSLCEECKKVFVDRMLPGSYEELLIK
jgi:hypothetical protein